MHSDALTISQIMPHEASGASKLLHRLNLSYECQSKIQQELESKTPGTLISLLSKGNKHLQRTVLEQVKSKPVDYSALANQPSLCHVEHLLSIFNP